MAARGFCGAGGAGGCKREMKEVTVSPKEAAELHMTNPKLWWPNTYGDPNLYKMHVSFDVNGAESDARDTNFGVRKITYQVTPDNTLIPQTLNLTGAIVNGVPIMCKGGCWGMDEAMKPHPAEVLDAKVQVPSTRQLHHDPQLGGIPSTERRFLCRL